MQQQSTVVAKWVCVCKRIYHTFCSVCSVCVQAIVMLLDIVCDMMIMTKYAKENPAIPKVHTPAIAELTALNTSHMLTMNNLKERHMLMMNKLERTKKGCTVGDEQPERNKKRCILVMNLEGRRKAAFWWWTIWKEQAKAACHNEQPHRTSKMCMLMLNKLKGRSSKAITVDISLGIIRYGILLL